jgi:hypothetical protein
VECQRIVYHACSKILLKSVRGRLNDTVELGVVGTALPFFCRGEQR